MSDQSQSTEVADRFGAVAQEFCSVVESAFRLDRIRLLTEVYRVLPRLIDEAIKLPSLVTGDVDDASQKEGVSPSSPNVGMTDEQWGQVYNLLKEKLGDWDLYWQVFDPTTDKEAVCGTVADDIADIYRDLKEGLVLRETVVAGRKISSGNGACSIILTGPPRDQRFAGDPFQAARGAGMNQEQAIPYRGVFDSPRAEIE